MAKSSKPATDSLPNLKHRVAELELNWKRALADYQNLEKRVAQEQIEFVKFASASLIDKLLSVVDDLERAVAHHQDKGLELILSRLTDILKSEGVAEIQAQSQPFNPQTMDAVDMVQGPENAVVSLVSKGYTLNGKVLRPAKVTVGSGTDDSHPEGKSKDQIIN